MTSFHYPADVQYELQARYPDNVASITPDRSRSALRINLEVWRARRAAKQGR